jgi:hypothetical protein
MAHSSQYGGETLTRTQQSTRAGFTVAACRTRVLSITLGGVTGGATAVLSMPVSPVDMCWRVSWGKASTCLPASIPAAAVSASVPRIGRHAHTHWRCAVCPVVVVHWASRGTDERCPDVVHKSVVQLTSVRQTTTRAGREGVNPTARAGELGAPRPPSRLGTSWYCEETD